MECDSEIIIAYAKLARAHIAKTGNTAKLIWTMMEKKPQEDAKEERVVHTA